jgi:hypothetical protein
MSWPLAAEPSSLLSQKRPVPEMESMVGADSTDQTISNGVSERHEKFPCASTKPACELGHGEKRAGCVQDVDVQKRVLPKGCPR